MPLPVSAVTSERGQVILNVLKKQAESFRLAARRQAAWHQVAWHQAAYHQAAYHQVARPNIPTLSCGERETTSRDMYASDVRADFLP